MTKIRRRRVFNDITEPSNSKWEKFRKAYPGKFNYYNKIKTSSNSHHNPSNDWKNQIVDQ